MYFLYSFGSSLTIHLANVPFSSMQTACSMSACSNVPGMLVNATYLPSSASMVHDSSIASNDTDGELVSDFVLFSLYDLPSAHPLALKLPSRFTSRNIRYCSTFFFSSCDMFSFLYVNCLLFCSQ